jgi:hypothetical protein
MAKKKTTQAKTKQKSKFSLFEDKHPLATAALMIAVLVIGFIGYNKFLDYKNVQDMKGLLSDFQQLERDIETETGEEFHIQASCSSGGKFGGVFYFCGIYLENKNLVTYEYEPYLAKLGSKINDKNDCRIVTSEDATALGAYSCIIDVRPSSQQKSEEIFYDYDTSPGWPL